MSFGRRAAGNQRMEPGDGAAGDGDEHEGKHLAAKERARAVDEGRDGRHLDLRMRDDDRDRQQDHGAELEERRQVVARRQQQPHRQDRGQEAVDDHEPGERQGGVVEQHAQLRLMIEPAAAEQRAQHQRHAEHRAFEHPPRSPRAQVQPHDDGRRNGGKHGRAGPRAVLHDVHDHEAQHGAQDHHDEQGADEGGEAAEGPELIARHLPDAAAVAARGHQQHRHVLHATAEHRADEDPQRPGQVAELGGERRPDEWPGTGDGGEVMSEDDRAVRGHEVTPVVQPLRGRCPGRIHVQYAGGDPGGVEAIAEQVDADRGGDDPQRVDRLVPVQGDPTDREGPPDRQQHAGQFLQHVPPPLMYSPAAARSTFA